MKSSVGCEYGSVSDEGILEDVYDLKTGTSLEDEGTEGVTDSNNDLQDSDVASYYRCGRSFSDDSGFNSDNESRDSVDESAVGTGCRCFRLECDCLENSTLDSLPQGSKNLTIKLKSVQLKSHEKPDPVLLNNKLRKVDSDNIIDINNIPTRNQIASKRHRPDAAANLRTVRRSRRAVQDLNNNEASSRNLNSYLKKAPFKLQDCFQHQGFLSLIACIIYTLVLMVIIGFLSMIMASLKSYIGTRNLKTMRKSIVQHRRTRESMSAG